VNEFIAILTEKYGVEIPHDHTITAPTNTLGSQLEVYDHCASSAQSTSTNSTNALIAQVQVQDLCVGPSQNTNALTTQVQAQELQLQPEASMRYVLSILANLFIDVILIFNKIVLILDQY